ncbi:MAG: hypothetical protein KME18_09265 [Phormidium tanganyikae FI6-MK23]|jgi:uncharacterized protein YlxW (UPF0749 family)|nr:hypothetical protein [Phormidium tanganyikae FI6-MK23]
MIKQIFQSLEIVRLQADVKRLRTERDELKQELSNIQSEYERYRAGELIRKDDFLQDALKYLINSGAITDNRSAIR